MLELRYTNGVGTYRSGKLAGIRRKKITPSEFRRIEQSFENGNFYQLSPTLRENNGYYGFTVSEEKGEEELICLHAPTYYLESYRNGEHHLLYRYCQDDYEDGLKVAMPLIELAEVYFPKEMEGITAFWLQEKRETAQKKVIEQNGPVK